MRSGERRMVWEQDDLALASRKVEKTRAHLVRKIRRWHSSSPLTRILSHFLRATRQRWGGTVLWRWSAGV